MSSTAANLYAALAASALEDEEELLAAQNEAQQNSQASALKQELQQPVVKTEPPVVKVEPPPPVKVEQPEQQEPETPRQVIVPAIQNQQGQLILHGIFTFLYEDMLNKQVIFFHVNALWISLITYDLL